MKNKSANDLIIYFLAIFIFPSGCLSSYHADMDSCLGSKLPKLKEYKLKEKETKKPKKEKKQIKFWDSPSEFPLELSSSPRNDEEFLIKKKDATPIHPSKRRVLSTENIVFSIYSFFKLIEKDIVYLSKSYSWDSSIQKALKMWSVQNGWGPIYINLFGESNNSYYMRSENNHRLITLGYKIDSIDAVIHQSAHAVLDLIWKELFSQINMFTGSFHESFSDWMIISNQLNQTDFCELAHMELSSKTDTPFFMKKIFRGLYRDFWHTGLERFVEERAHISRLNGNVRAQSLLLTGIFWSILKRAHAELSRINEAFFQKKINRKKENMYTSFPFKMTYDLNLYFRRILIQTILQARKDGNIESFETLGFLMRAIASNHQNIFSPITQIPWGVLIREEFEKRGILLAQKLSLKDPRDKRNKKQTKSFQPPNSGSVHNKIGLYEKLIAEKQKPDSKNESRYGRCEKIKVNQDQSEEEGSSSSSVYRRRNPHEEDMGNVSNKIGFYEKLIAEKQRLDEKKEVKYKHSEKIRNNQKKYEEERRIAKLDFSCQTLSKHLHSQYDPDVFNEFFEDKIIFPNKVSEQQSQTFMQELNWHDQIENHEKKISESKQSFLRVLRVLEEAP